MASWYHEKSVIGKQFLERLLAKRRKDDVEPSKSKREAAARQKALKEKKQDEAKIKGQATKSKSKVSSAAKSKVKLISSITKDKNKRVLNKSNLELPIEKSDQSKTLKEPVEKEHEEIVEQEPSQAATNPIKYKPGLGKGGKPKAVVAAAHGTRRMRLRARKSVNELVTIKMYTVTRQLAPV
ncbi:hypothetical protein M9H77_21956 [Catharanthus roseus]|uniref:Uncharacterized protein n=1 Tax=Catharanthus roseus TaxID=4058 RepID=A0ACC0AT55_CATRO|nr:hypothetical protein M9H77_21956 [Catharanthus roseus]